MGQVVKVFSTVHDKFLGYLKTTNIDQQVRFAQVWNEIIDSMRLEVRAYYIDYYYYLLIHHVLLVL
jgi:hypothetical protein